MSQVNGNRTRWTDQMLKALVRMRETQHLPLIMCAERLGVAEGIVRLKARELGIAGRMNAGRRAGWKRATEAAE